MSSTSANVLSNLFFNENYYLQQKTNALNATASLDTLWTVEDTRDAIDKAGMSPWEHFVQYGAYEKNANGDVGIDPSAFFSVSKYYLDLAIAKNISASDVISEIREAGNPIHHYATVGHLQSLTPKPVYDGDKMLFYSRELLFSKFYFDEYEYVANKAAALNAEHFQGKEWTEDDVFAAINDAGMSPWEHFTKFGAFEKDANGDIGIDPSQYFDVSRYYSDKAQSLSITVEETIEGFKKAQTDPVTHYTNYGVVDQLAARATSLDAVHINEDTNVPPLSGNSLIDSLLIREENWPSANRVAAKDGIVRYHYLTDSEIAANTENEYDNMAQLTKDQCTGYEQALTVLNKFTGVKFEETDSVTDANWLFATATFDPDVSGMTGPKAGWGEDVLVVALSNDYNENKGNITPTFGNGGFATVCHELGHAMGLEHPFATSTDDDGQQHILIPKQIETTALSIMSYDRGTEALNIVADAVAPWCEDGTFYYSPVDVVALQYLYGTDGINGEEGIVYDTTVLA